MSAGNILTTGGFTKLPPISQSTKDCKIVLYYLQNPTSEKVKKAKDAISQELGKGGWTYEGDLGSFEEEIEHKGYLLREGKTLELLEGSEIGGQHHIKVSNTARYLFESLVKVRGGFHISGSNAEITIHELILPPLLEQKQIQPIIQCLTSHPDFIGRMTDLERLKEALLSERKASDQTRFCFLYGLGGVGKSELSICFANMHQEDLPLVWFFPASSDQLLYQEYQALAKRLKLPFFDQDGLEVLQKRVHRHLEENFDRHPYLLIFDNIENRMDSKKLPQRGGTILMTSREKSHWADSHSRMRLEKFEKEDALELLKKVTQEEISEDMRKLSETLDYFPFLLSQVAHYIETQNTTIAEYLSDYDFKQDEEVELGDRYHEKFATVWEITFNKLHQERPLALEWLKVCAFLHPDSIPVKWLEEWLKAQSIENPPKEKIKMLGTLSKYALIQERDPKSKAISLHRLLQQSLQSQVKDLSGFILNVYQFIKKHSKDFDYKNGNHEWVPHGEKILKSLQENKLFVQDIETKIYNYIGAAYYFLGNYQKALEYHQNDLSNAKRLKDQESMGRAYSNIGLVYRLLGKYDATLKYHNKHLEIAKFLGDKIGIVKAYGNIGNAHSCIGEYQKAISYYEKCLRTMEHLGDKEGMGLTYGNIGIAYDFLKDYQKALDYHQKHLEIAKSLDDKRGIGRACCNIGNVHNTLGKYQKALEYHKKDLKIAQDLDDQGSKGRAYCNIADAYYSNGKYEQAKDYYEQALAIAKKIRYREVEDFAKAQLAKLNSKDVSESQPKEEISNLEEIL